MSAQRSPGGTLGSDAWRMRQAIRAAAALAETGGFPAHRPPEGKRWLPEAPPRAPGWFLAHRAFAEAGRRLECDRPTPTLADLADAMGTRADWILGALAGPWGGPVGDPYLTLRGEVWIPGRVPPEPGG